MTLKRLQIKNFQCHEDLRIKLDPHVTAIIGPSDTGKSAIIRGIKWVATNRPRGDGFIRFGAKEASVSLWSDNTKVRRSKGKENKYEVNKTELKAVGTDVPEQVRNSLNIDEMNFQGQHESPFWFDLTPGEVAKRLNDIVDLGLIDSTMASLASSYRKAKSEMDVYETQLTEAKEELDSLSYVAELDYELQTLEEKLEEAGMAVSSADNLSQLNEQIQTYLQKINNINSTKILVNGVKDLGEEAVRSAEELSELQHLIHYAVKHQEIVNREIPDTSEIEKLGIEAKEKTQQANTISTKIREAIHRVGKVEQYDGELTELKKELEELTEGICPLCGHELEEDECLM